jgi:hypothetical protein
MVILRICNFEQSERIIHQGQYNGLASIVGFQQYDLSKSFDTLEGLMFEPYCMFHLSQVQVFFFWDQVCFE